MSEKCTLEICCFNIQSVMNANYAGADRIELCTDQFAGGITPNAGLIEKALAVSGIPVFVMIRPRGGDFLYDDFEMEIMLRDIQYCKSVGVKGVVIGMLTTDGNIDERKLQLLIKEALPMQITFHRAIDMSKNPVEAIEILKRNKVNRVLTSGGFATAPEGISTITEMIAKANNTISIMAGSGVNATNLELLYKVGVREFHSSASEQLKSRMEYRNLNIAMGNKQSDEYNLTVASIEKIEAMQKKLDELRGIV